jgi:hypothetical protein
MNHGLKLANDPSGDVFEHALICIEFWIVFVLKGDFLKRYDSDFS